MNLEDLNHSISFYITPKKISEEIFSFFNQNNAEIDLNTNTIIIDKHKIYKKNLTFSEERMTSDSNNSILTFDKTNNELNVKFKEGVYLTSYELTELISYDSTINFLHLLKKYESAEKIDDLLVAYEEINEKLLKERTYYSSHISKVINFLYTAKTILEYNPEEIIQGFLKDKKINLNKIIIEITSEYKPDLKITLKHDENNYYHYEKLGDRKIYEKKAIRELKKGNDFSEMLDNQFKQFDVSIKEILSDLKTMQDVRYKLKDQKSEINRDFLDIHLLNNDGKYLGTDIFKIITKIEAINEKSVAKNRI